MKINKGDVIFIKYGILKSDEGRHITEKPHMFVVTSVSNNITACSTSSKEDKVNKMFPYNISLLNAIEAGFNKENTHVKVDRRINIKPEDVYKIVGHLSNIDYINVISAYNKVPASKYIIIETIN